MQTVQPRVASDSDSGVAAAGAANHLPLTGAGAISNFQMLFSPPMEGAAVQTWAGGQGEA